MYFVLLCSFNFLKFKGNILKFLKTKVMHIQLGRYIVGSATGKQQKQFIVTAGEGPLSQHLILSTGSGFPTYVLELALCCVEFSDLFYYLKMRTFLSLTEMSCTYHLFRPSCPVWTFNTFFYVFI